MLFGGVANTATTPFSARTESPRPSTLTRNTRRRRSLVLVARVVLVTANPPLALSADSAVLARGFRLRGRISDIGCFADTAGVAM